MLNNATAVSSFLESWVHRQKRDVGVVFAIGKSFVFLAHIQCTEPDGIAVRVPISPDETSAIHDPVGDVALKQAFDLPFEKGLVGERPSQDGSKIGVAGSY